MFPVPAAALSEVSAGTPEGAPLARADGDEPPENGTTHFSVVDANGNAVSYTSTVEGAFGSGLHWGGFYLNNELTDFSLSPEVDGVVVANSVEGGKRPRSSMAPTIVFDADGETVRVELGLSADGIEMIFDDGGAPFDPLAASDPDMPNSLDEAKIGGLGIMLVRKAATDLAYERTSQDRNRLTVKLSVD